MPDQQTRIYLDYHATTPVDRRVVATVVHHITEAFGNASSADHRYGDEAAAAVEVASERVGALVGARAPDVVFTSGATESINLVLQGMAAKAGEGRRLRIAVSPTEHSAVLDTCRALAKAGRAFLEILHVDARGRVSLEEIESVCRRSVDLLCVMAANNEVGTIAPVGEIGGIARAYGVPYLCDATQAYGRVPLDIDDGITFLALSAHKIHGPKGVGALVTRARRLLAPILHGGDQQGGLRAGTLNVPGIAGLGVASQLRSEEMDVDEQAIAARRNRLQDLLMSSVPGLAVNGDQEARLPGNLHVSFPDCPNGAIIARVRHRLAVATGAACSSGIEAPSHVLRAMGLSDSHKDGAIRIGVGKWTTDSEVAEAAALLADAWRAAVAQMAGPPFPRL